MATQFIKKLFTRDSSSSLTVSLKRFPGNAEHIYTTHDPIKGKITICQHTQPECDTSVVDLTVALVGRSNITVPNLYPWSGHASQSKVHTFLAMNEQRCSKDIRDIYTTENSTRWESDFTFTVPDKLLPAACKHEDTDNFQVIDSHIHLPPTFSASSSSLPNTLSDDLKPDTICVSYYILARARIKVDGALKIMEAQIPVRIIPISHEDNSVLLPRYTPNSTVGLDETSTQLARGQLTARVQRPPCLRVALLRDGDVAAVTTTLDTEFLLNLFDNQDLPPQLVVIQNRLHAYTYASMKPFESAPRPEDFGEYDAGRIIRRDSLSLARHEYGIIQWNQRESALRNSEQATHTTSMQLPIMLTTNTPSQASFLIPKFESCLMCRNYELETQVTFHYSRSEGVHGHKCLTMKTPLQVQVTPRVRTSSRKQTARISAEALPESVEAL